MKIRTLGGGIYGCHLALALRGEHEVELHEIAGRLFNGASGNGWCHTRACIGGVSYAQAMNEWDAWHRSIQARWRAGEKMS